MALRNNEPFHKEVINEIHKELNIDRRVVDFVSTHPFLFITHIMRDSLDLKAIMIRYLGKFAIRGGSKKAIGKI